jgi:hypothetical protein
VAARFDLVLKEIVARRKKTVAMKGPVAQATDFMAVAPFIAADINAVCNKVHLFSVTKERSPRIGTRDGKESIGSILQLQAINARESLPEKLCCSGCFEA